MIECLLLCKQEWSHNHDGSVLSYSEDEIYQSFRKIFSGKPTGLCLLPFELAMKLKCVVDECTWYVSWRS